MGTFKFEQHCKITVWERNMFSIEAETEEEAIAKAKKENLLLQPVYESGIEDIETETMFDTTKHIGPEENNGYDTIELYHNEKLIGGNAG